MKAIYPGSFNPWHKGHDDILTKALKVFPVVVIAIGENPDKSKEDNYKYIYHSIYERCSGDIDCGQVELIKYDGLLVKAIGKYNKKHYKENKYGMPVWDDLIGCVIRGIRNEEDFRYERTLQYYNEDLEIGVPTFYIISDRTVSHISSTAERSLAKLALNTKQRK